MQVNPPNSMQHVSPPHVVVTPLSTWHVLFGQAASKHAPAAAAGQLAQFPSTQVIW